MQLKKFIVAIHDISPLWQNEIEQILALLSPFIEDKMSGAIINGCSGEYIDKQITHTIKPQGKVVKLHQKNNKK